MSTWAYLGLAGCGIKLNSSMCPRDSSTLRGGSAPIPQSAGFLFTCHRVISDPFIFFKLPAVWCLLMRPGSVKTRDGVCQHGFRLIKTSRLQASQCATGLLIHCKAGDVYSDSDPPHRVLIAVIGSHSSRPNIGSPGRYVADSLDLGSDRQWGGDRNR